MSDFRQVAQYLTASGDGLGPIDANLNFGAPTEWFIKPPAFGQLPQPTGVNRILLFGMVMSIRDSDWTPDGFGGLSALPNGISFQVKESLGGNVLVDFMGENTLHSNYELAGISTGFVPNVVSAPGMTMLTFQYDFRPVGGVELIAEENEYFTVILNDDLSGLDQLRFFMFGQTGARTQ